MDLEQPDEIISLVQEEDFKEDQDDIFGFVAAKRKVSAIRKEKYILDIENATYYAANRVFVNHGDSYHGKYIVQEISQTKFVDTENSALENLSNVLDDEFDERTKTVVNYTKNIQTPISNYTVESDNSVLKELKSAAAQTTYPENKPIIKVALEDNKPRNYDVLTTVKNKLNINSKGYKYLKSLKKVIVSKNKVSLMKEIKKCSVVIYDVSIDGNQIAEAKQAIKEMLEVIDFVKDHPESDISKQNGTRVFILISSILTWAFTQKNNNTFTSLTQEDYSKRICHPNFKSLYDMENYILLLNDLYKGYFCGIVLAPGIVYGRGEYAFEYIYSTALGRNEQMLIPENNNYLPIIHVQNLSKIVRNIVVHYEKISKPYLIAVETSKFSLCNITEAIRDEVNKQEYVYCDYSSLFLNKTITQTIYDMITTSLQILPLIDDNIMNVFSEDELSSHTFNKANQLIAEYLYEKNMFTNKIVINGPFGTSDIAKQIAKTYDLEFFDVTTTSQDFINALESQTYSIFTSTNKTTKISSSTILKVSSNNSRQNENENYNAETNKIKEIIKEQKKQIKDKGQISIKYLIPFIQKKLWSSEGLCRGYIIHNYPETIQEAQIVFETKPSNETYTFLPDIDISPTIIIDLVMTGETVKHDDMFDSPSETTTSSMPKNVFSKDTMYSENDIVQHMFNNDFLEIRKNRQAVNYMISRFQPKVLKKYLTIELENPELLSLNYFDELYESILADIPLETKNNCYDITEMKTKINQILNENPIEQIEINMEHNDNVIDKSADILKQKQDKEEEQLLLNNAKLINFLIKVVNPILVRGIIEVSKNQPSDPVDALAEYIYNNNTYDPCATTPPIKKKKSPKYNIHLL